MFSIETSGVFNLDSELDLIFIGIGKVGFEFTGASDIVQIGKIISSYVYRYVQAKNINRIEILFVELCNTKFVEQKLF